MASVPITALLYNGPLLCGFNVGIKGLISIAHGLRVVVDVIYWHRSSAVYCCTESDITWPEVCICHVTLIESAIIHCLTGNA